MNYQFYVYILTNLRRTTYYTGVTNNLKRRILEHYENRGKNEGFTGRHHAYYLLYFETFRYINNAISREKEIKGWRREKKLKLIQSKNPELRFLNEELFGKWPPSAQSASG